jgi:integrase/recombinase XerC
MCDLTKVEILDKSKAGLVNKPKSKNYYAEDNIKYFTVQELDNLLSHVKNNFYKMVYLLLYETASRFSEIRYLKFSNVEGSPDNTFIKIPIAKQRDKKQIKRVPISPVLVSYLSEHRIKRNLTNKDYLLAKKTGGKPVSNQTINMGLKRYIIKYLGNDYADKSHSHAFRHSRAIHLLDAGVNIRIVQRLLGHSSITNTLIYLKYSD